MKLSVRAGLTMIELLVVLAIIAVILGLMYLSIPRYINRSRDALRKTHLEKYRVGLEDYFNDKGRYPTGDIMSNCGGSDLQPYINVIECDPLSKEPYRYVVSADGASYQLFTQLVDDHDPIIDDRGCNAGCGPDDDGNGSGDYNFGVGSEQVITGEGGVTTDIRPTCYDAFGNPYCESNTCQICCPGNVYRCNAAGNGCYVDYACSD